MKFSLLLMAGKGTRTGLDIPKQYVYVEDKPLFAFSLSILYKSKSIDEIILVVDSLKYEYVKNYICINNLDDKCEVCIGGSTRKESVLKGILYLGNRVNDEDIILVHDAARPFITEEIINKNIEIASKNVVAVTATSASNTILELDDDSKIKRYLSRSCIKEVQTPQTFKYELFKKVKTKYEKEGKETDDSTIFFNNGFDIEFIEGSIFNFKITTNDDLLLFKILARRN